MSELPELPRRELYANNKAGELCFKDDTIEALEARLRRLAEYSWHNDPCDWLGDNTLACTCRHDELRAKLTRENLI